MAGVVEGLAPLERRLPPPECLPERIGWGEAVNGCDSLAWVGQRVLLKVIRRLVVVSVGERWLFFRLCFWFSRSSLLSSYQPTLSGLVKGGD